VPRLRGPAGGRRGGLDGRLIADDHVIGVWRHVTRLALSFDARHGSRCGPSQECRANQQVNHDATGRQVQSPQPCRLRQREPQPGHLNELTSNAISYSMNFDRRHHHTSFNFLMRQLLRNCNESSKRRSSRGGPPPGLFVRALGEDALKRVWNCA
jgi:hypothetical protein